MRAMKVLNTFCLLVLAQLRYGDLYCCLHYIGGGWSTVAPWINFNLMGNNVSIVMKKLLILSNTHNQYCVALGNFRCMEEGENTS